MCTEITAGMYGRIPGLLDLINGSSNNLLYGLSVIER